MDIKKAAHDMEALILERHKSMSIPQQDLEYGVNHIRYMCRRIYNGFVSGDLAILWLGYVQGVVRAGGGADLDELKGIMERASKSALSYEKSDKSS